MDYSKLSLDELKAGSRFDSERKTYICNYCAAEFREGQIFQFGEHFYTAEHAAAEHITCEHGGNLTQLLYSDTKYNRLTGHQRELLELFFSGASDHDIAQELSVSEVTVRRQRFTFGEKAKQAKFYLAVYEQVFEKRVQAESRIDSIHNNANCVDDWYAATPEEEQHILNMFFRSLNPLVLRAFTTKEQYKVVILHKIAEQFERGRFYSEKATAKILKPIYEDYITIRRYLVLYGFMERAKDGSGYWLSE